MSLKSFIKSVRAAKTIADERAVIQKESAAIRTSFRDDYIDQSIRRNNVAKLLYLYTLGERTHFGQIECLKLLATSRFGDKRLGYLGTMLLLDENQEVLTLLTNSLSNDLQHPNQYVAALALCTLANIASQEMARDLFLDIEKILSSSNPYLKKKAALCAMRIINRVPELEENFIEKAKLLVNEKNHGVLLCGCALIQDMVLANPALVPEFQSIVPTLLKQLKVIIGSGYAPEHDVLGVGDPFLQVRIIRLLRILGENDPSIAEQMSDTLAQIASNTDSSKNAGNAILYEAVLAIFGVASDSGLRVFGVNILGKFLANKDNNTRYVALNTLLKVIELEPTAVQRHRATIVECLQDADISIRRRALELSYSLINEQNIRVLVRELLSFLETADSEFKSGLVSQIALAAEKYAPTKRWHVDTIVRALKLAGSYARKNVLSSFITLVIQAEDLQLYTTQKLYSTVKDDITQEGLTIVAVWLIGEYGDVLLRGGSFQDDKEQTQTVSEKEIIDLFSAILNSSFATDSVNEYVCNALIKLSVRFSSAGQIERIRRLLESLNRSLNVEIQQRVVEYTKLFEYDSIRRGVLEKIPAPELREDLSKQAEKEKAKKGIKHGVAKPKVNGAPNINSVDLLLDLASDVSPTPGEAAATGPSSSDLLSDIFGGPGTSASPAISSTVPASTSTNNQSILDLFGPSPGAATTSSVTPAAAPPTVASNDLGSLLGGSSPEPISQGTSEGIEAYNGHQLSVKLTGEKGGPGSAAITAYFHNSGSTPISGLTLQVAVPKSQKLALQAISTSNLSSFASATQAMKITGPPGGNVKLRMRLSFNVEGQQIQEQLDFNKFPAGLL